MKHFVRLLPVFLILSPAALPQDHQAVTVGVKGGIPVTGAFHDGQNFNFDTKRYTIGPTIEVHLPHGVGIEVDALYKRLSFASNSGDFFSSSATTANSWEFPVMLKLRPWVDSPVHPFFTPGVSFRHLSGLREVRQFLGSDRVETNRPATLENRFTAGFVLGAGIEFRPSQYFRIAPEFRYTRWGWDNFRDPGSAFRSGQNQAEFLLGLTF